MADLEPRDMERTERELGHQLQPTALRTTECAAAVPSGPAKTKEFRNPLDKTLLKRVDRGGCPGGDPDLVVDMGYMVLYRFSADAQAATDLRCILSLSEQ